MLVRQIQLCERLLGRSLSNAEELTACSLDELRGLAERLESETGSIPCSPWKPKV